MDEQQQLTNAYHSNKLSHAYLFEGDDAQTMKQVAINFAKLILCQTDSQCETKVSTYNHPDFMYISTTENAIKKEQFEQLVSNMNQLPIESTNKVYIIVDFRKVNCSRGKQYLESFPRTTGQDHRYFIVYKT